MERLFQKLSLAFGNQVLAKWQGLDMQAVYAGWAESLHDVSLGAIGFAVGKSKTELAHPPSLSEFRKICLEYVPPQSNVLKISHKLSEEQKQKNRERMAAIAEQFARRVAL